MDELDWLLIGQQSVKYFQLTEEGKTHVMEDDNETPTHIWDTDFQVRRISEDLFKLLDGGEGNLEPIVERKYLKPTEIVIEEADIRKLEVKKFRKRYGIQ